MALLVLVISTVLAQSGAQAAPPPPNCLAPADESVIMFCSGEDLMRGTGQGAERTATMKRAAEAFRRAATVATDSAVKKLALTRLETVYDKQHLNLPQEL